MLLHKEFLNLRLNIYALTLKVVYIGYYHEQSNFFHNKYLNAIILATSTHKNHWKRRKLHCNIPMKGRIFRTTHSLSQFHEMIPTNYIHGMKWIIRGFLFQWSHLHNNITIELTPSWETKHSSSSCTVHMQFVGRNPFGAIYITDLTPMHTVVTTATVLCWTLALMLWCSKIYWISQRVNCTVVYTYINRMPNNFLSLLVVTIIVRFSNLLCFCMNKLIMILLEVAGGFKTL
jgi:hypothetical protein